jgi:hypothetical protein
VPIEPDPARLPAFGRGTRLAAYAVPSCLPYGRPAPTRARPRAWPRRFGPTSSGYPGPPLRIDVELRATSTGLELVLAHDLPGGVDLAVAGHELPTAATFVALANGELHIGEPTAGARAIVIRLGPVADLSGRRKGPHLRVVRGS